MNNAAPLSRRPLDLRPGTSCPPPHVPDLDTAVSAVHRAARDGDRAAFERRFARLDRSLRAHRGQIFRNAAGLDLDELHQKVLIRVNAYFEQPEPESVRSARGWLRTMAANAAIDEHRSRARFRARHVAEDSPAAAHTEQSGVFPRADFLVGLAQETRALDAAIRHYADAAAAAAPPTSRARAQIWSCYWLRIRAASAATVAERLRQQDLGEPSEQTLWQWASRGQRLLEQLCAADADRDRAELVLDRLR